MKRLLWIGSFTYLLIGFTHIIIGSLLTEILDYYNKGYTDGGVLIASQSIGFLMGVIISSFILRYFGRRRILVTAIMTIAIAQSAFVLLFPWELLLLFAVICGVGFGLIEPLVGSLIIDGVKEKQAVAFSRLEVFFGLGSLIMPIVSGWLATTDLWRFSFLILSIYAIAMGLLWMKNSFGELDHLMVKTQKETKNTKNNSDLLRNSPLLLGGFILFFAIYVGTEVSVMNFLPSILISKLNADTYAATIAITIFWGAMVVGRLVAGHLAEKLSYSMYLILCCLGMVLFVGSLGFVTSLWAGYLIIIMMGLMMAGIFGIAVVYANQLLKGSTDRNTSILIAAGGVGGIFLPLATGGIMDQFSTFTVSIVLGGLALVMFIFIILTKMNKVVSKVTLDVKQ